MKQRKLLKNFLIFFYKDIKRLEESMRGSDFYLIILIYYIKNFIM